MLRLIFRPLRVARFSNTSSVPHSAVPWMPRTSQRNRRSVLVRDTASLQAGEQSEEDQER
jgi:hypothetical protein